MNTSAAHWRLAFIALLACLIAPLFLIDFPPLMDLPNHLARLYILSTHDTDPVLSHMWHSDWHLLPNIAIDIIGPLLMALTSVEIASRMILIMIIMLFMSGSILLHRAIFGRRSAWPFLASLFVYNAIFLMGFLNYLLGVGIALHAAASWVARLPELRSRRLFLSLVFTGLLFFCHIFALAFYLIFIGAWQLGEVMEERPRRFMIHLTPLFPAGLFALALCALAPAGEGHVVLLSALRQKAEYALSPFLNYSQVLDVASALLFVISYLWLLMCGQLEIPYGIRIFIGILALVFLLCPMGYGNAAFLDARLPLLLWLIAVIGVSPRAVSLATGRMLAAGAGLLLAVRLVTLGEVWLEARNDLSAMRSLETHLSPGASVLEMIVTPEDSNDPASYYKEQPRSRELRGIAAAYLHLPAFWVIERQVFWSLLFVNPAQQPIKPLPPYDSMSVRFTAPPDYRLLAEPALLRQKAMLDPYLVNWQEKFDYVVVLSAGRARHLDMFSALPLTLVARTDIAALYKVQRPAARP